MPVMFGGGMTMVYGRRNGLARAWKNHLVSQYAYSLSSISEKEYALGS